MMVFIFQVCKIERRNEMDAKENETEKFYVHPIKQIAYDLASKLSQSVVIDKNIANYTFTELEKNITYAFESEEK